MLLPSGNPFKCHKEFFLSLQPTIPPKHFDVFPPDWGICSEGLGTFRFFLKQHAVWCLKKNQNASSLKTLSGQTCFKGNLNSSRPSEHPPVRGKNVETFRWDHRLQIQNLFMALNLNGFPDGSNIAGSTI